MHLWITGTHAKSKMNEDQSCFSQVGKNERQENVNYIQIKSGYLKDELSLVELHALLSQVAFL